MAKDALRSVRWARLLTSQTDRAGEGEKGFVDERASLRGALEGLAELAQGVPVLA